MTLSTARYWISNAYDSRVFRDPCIMYRNLSEFARLVKNAVVLPLRQIMLCNCSPLAQRDITFDNAVDPVCTAILLQLDVHAALMLGSTSRHWLRALHSHALWAAYMQRDFPSQYAKLLSGDEADPDWQRLYRDAAKETQRANRFQFGTPWPATLDPALRDYWQQPARPHRPFHDHPFFEPRSRRSTEFPMERFMRSEFGRSPQSDPYGLGRHL